MLLAHRELRDQFRAIDCTETGGQWTEYNASPESTGLVRYVMKRFVGALAKFMGLPDIGES
jgi:hypothetical protein